MWPRDILFLSNVTRGHIFPVKCGTGTYSSYQMWPRDIFFQSNVAREQILPIKCGSRHILPIKCGPEIYFSYQMWPETYFSYQIWPGTYFSYQMWTRDIFFLSNVARGNQKVLQNWISGIQLFRDASKTVFVTEIVRYGRK